MILLHARILVGASGCSWAIHFGGRDGRSYRIGPTVAQPCMTLDEARAELEKVAAMFGACAHVTSEKVLDGAA